MLGKHSSIQTGPREGGKLFTWLVLIHSAEQITSREGGRYGGGKELAEPIFFIKAEPGIAVLGGCCVSSAWSRHSDTMGGNCLVCIRAAMDWG